MFKKTPLFLFSVILTGLVFMTKTAEAAVIPQLNLNVVGNGAEVTLTGDKGFDIELHYGPGASKVVKLGQTDMSGNFHTPISLDSYNIDCGNTAYVVINGQVSPTIPWTNPAKTCATSTVVNYAPIGSPNQAPILTSFSISSNGVNNQFITVGSVINISFSVNQAVTGAVAWVANNQISLSGNNSGPYTGSYTVTSRDTLPLNLILHFSNINGLSTDQHFVLGKSPVVANTSPAVAGLVPVGINNSKYIFTTLLKLNDTGTAVTELQKRLTALGFYSGPVTGKFGGLTFAAVKAFQKANGIDQFGYLGPATRTALNK
jgi:hypothetical protein